MGIDHLSTSQVNMFLRCPAQYEFRYTKGLRVPPAGVMIQGTAYHDTIAQDLISKRDGGELLTDDDIIDAYATSFDRNIIHKVIEDDEEKWEFDEIVWEEDPDKVKDDGTKYALLYHREKANTINPVEIENRITTEVAGVPFVLIADVVEAGRVIDHKLRGKRQSENDIRQDLQSVAYTMFYKRPFEWHNVIKLKTPVIEITHTERTTEDFARFEGLVSNVIQAINKGVFYPNPIGWHCSERFCGYWDKCQGKYYKGGK